VQLVVGVTGLEVLQTRRAGRVSGGGDDGVVLVFQLADWSVFGRH
jgi:hypothetical protein